MALELKIGLDAITSYRRLAYTPWHAIAEFVDNSTQAYFDNKDVLDEAYRREGTSLLVGVVYEADAVMRVSDNSIGMSYAELERALHVALPPPNTSGRSKYGMGMKIVNMNGVIKLLVAKDTKIHAKDGSMENQEKAILKHGIRESVMVIFVLSVEHGEVH